MMIGRRGFVCISMVSSNITRLTFFVLRVRRNAGMETPFHAWADLLGENRTICASIIISSAPGGL
jgi:hypothetical protein